MPKQKKSTEQDMAAAKDTPAKELAVKDMTTSFLQVLDNDLVITKLAQMLSVSICLMLDEKMDQLNKRFDKINLDNKNLSESQRGRARKRQT